MPGTGRPQTIPFRCQAWRCRDGFLLRSQPSSPVNRHSGNTTREPDFANATGAWNTANPGPAWLDDQKLAAMDYANLGWNLTGYLTFDGLDPDQVYTIELIASRNAAQADAEYRIGNEVIMFNPQTHGYVNGQWMTWTDISPDATGKISIQCGKLGSHSYNVYVNALRLTPEPATVALLVLGGLGMIRRKR